MYPSLECHYHSNSQLITMCICPSCAVPLCSKCINPHLSQSSVTQHQILPIADVFDLKQSELGLAADQLAKQLNELNDKYRPESCLKEYMEIVDRYKKEAIDLIEAHFQQLKTQLHKQLTVVYQATVQNWLDPLSEHLKEIKNNLHAMGDPNSILPAVIRTIDSQVVDGIAELLKNVNAAKSSYSSQLPRLVDSDAGKVRMVSQLSGFSNQTSPSFEMTGMKYGCTSNTQNEQFRVPSDPYSVQIDPLITLRAQQDNITRIVALEQKLLQLRSPGLLV